MSRPTAGRRAGGERRRRPLNAWLAAACAACPSAVAQVFTFVEGEGARSVPSSSWRLVNLDPVSYGWNIGELRLFSDSGCLRDMTRPSSKHFVPFNATSSGFDGLAPERAFDSYTWTEWRSQCYLCGPGEAWLGVNFTRPVQVYCVMLWQWGRREYRSGQVSLQFLSSGSGVPQWRSAMRGVGLDSNRWDQVRFVRCASLTPPWGGTVEVDNGGYYPSTAQLTCALNGYTLGPKTLQCGPDGNWNDVWSRCWTPIEMLVVASVVIGIDFALIFLYFLFVVRRAPPPLIWKSYIADTRMGAWTQHWLWDARKGHRRTFLQLLLCPSCRLAQTWRATSAMSYTVGALLSQLCVPFVPCIGALMRANIRDRFNIDESRISDLLLWTCCIPLVAMQEAKHVDTMTKHSADETEARRKEAQRKKDREEQVKAALEEQQQIYSAPSAASVVPKEASRHDEVDIGRSTIFK